MPACLLLLPRLSSQHNTCHIRGAGKLEGASDFSKRASIREYVVEDAERSARDRRGSGTVKRGAKLLSATHAARIGAGS